MFTPINSLRVDFLSYIRITIIFTSVEVFRVKAGNRNMLNLRLKAAA
jgi:hypothetical protein